ncbi:peptidase [Pasteurellaceae bacterium USgator11]|nr:peptidase [Pasteurellaceae bacterium USgator41]TNG98705.1 peptidase [Pasteurellaceae bacterium UScroc31]TNH00072.1 peptidase [Pasteurellaceae bacterium USgator11]
MQLIEIFRAGTRKDAHGIEVTITRDDLQHVVENYSSDFHEAPLVVGHPKMDAPAYGWVDKLVLDGDVLKAQPKDVDTEFAELVGSGKYKKISAAFYRPNGTSNPKPNGWYLRHVGFLGAMPPAVKGLKDPIFNDNEADVVEFSEWTTANLWQRMRDFFISQFGLETADNVMPAWQVQSLHDEAVREDLKQINSAEIEPHFNEPQQPNEPIPEPQPDNLPQGETMSEQEKQRLAELEAENAALKAEQAKVAKAAAEAENATFAESLINEGKLTPKQKDAALDLLNADHSSVEFSESGFKDKLKAFLSELPKAVEFAEIATKDKAATAQDDSVEYAEGTDPNSIEVDKQIRAYAKKHNVDYSTAFNAIYQ